MSVSSYVCCDVGKHGLVCILMSVGSMAVLLRPGVAVNLQRGLLIAPTNMHWLWPHWAVVALVSTLLRLRKQACPVRKSTFALLLRRRDKVLSMASPNKRLDARQLGYSEISYEESCFFLSFFLPDRSFFFFRI